MAVFFEPLRFFLVHFFCCCDISFRGGVSRLCFLCRWLWSVCLLPSIMTQGHWVGNKFWQFYKKKGPFWPTWPRGPPGTFRTLISSRFGLKVFVLMNYHRNIGVFPSLNSVCLRATTANSWSYNNLRIPSLINVLSCIKLIIQMHLNVSQGKAGEEQETLWCPLTKA